MLLNANSQTVDSWFQKNVLGKYLKKLMQKNKIHVFSANNNNKYYYSSQRELWQ